MWLLVWFLDLVWVEVLQFDDFGLQDLVVVLWLVVMDCQLGYVYDIFDCFVLVCMDVDVFVFMVCNLIENVELYGCVLIWVCLIEQVFEVGNCGFVVFLDWLVYLMCCFECVGSCEVGLGLGLVIVEMLVKYVGVWLELLLLQLGYVDGFLVCVYFVQVLCQDVQLNRFFSVFQFWFMGQVKVQGIEIWLQWIEICVLVCVLLWLCSVIYKVEVRFVWFVFDL